MEIKITAEEWLGKDNKLGLDILRKKYLYKDEAFGDWVNRVSGGDDELAQLILDKKFLFGGRVLSNRGLNNGNFYNCFSAGFVEDDYEDIMEVAKKLGLTYKAQGGQGLSLSKLRPKGTPIGDRYASDGIIPFMELYNTVTSITSQAGSRKGALLISLDIRHKEAEDFITIKTNPDRITKANLSLEIDDEFMEAVQAYFDTGEEVVLHEQREYSGHVVEYDITPIKLYKKMMECAYDYGEPGCIFTEEFRNYNMLEFDDVYNIDTCNPCVTADTLILTDDGYKKISNVAGNSVSVWNGYCFSKVVPIKTGENQKIVEIEFSNGAILKCTPYHKFILNDDHRVEAKDLRVGDKLQKHDMPIIYGYKTLKNAYTQGAFSGDGFMCEGRNGKHISLYGDKKNLSEFLDILSCREKSDKRHTYIIDVDHGKSFVPDGTYTVKDKLEWLAGLCDMDGSFQDGSIQITSVNYEFLKDVQLMLHTLGVNPTLAKSKDSGCHLMPDGAGGLKEYECRTLFKITIASSEVSILNRVGFKTHRISNLALPNRDAKRFITVVSIKKNNEIADSVYCFNEPKNHSGIFNGVLTANCGEQPLKKDSSCNLGSINLAEFIIDEYTDSACIDYKALADAIKISIRALDDIIDENMPHLPLEVHKINARDWRNIGLGVMGIGTSLFKLGIKYGSDEAIALIDELFNFLFRESVFADNRLAIERGSFPKYSKIMMDSRIMKAHFSDEELEQIHESGGLRNCSLLSIAPNGSISNLIGVTGGAEPEFAISYKRKTDNLDAEYDVYCNEAKYYMSKFNTEVLPDYFVCSSDIHWKDRIDMQAAMQKHIDTAISSTVNLPNSTTIEEVEQLYLYAWSKKLKGITIFRDGCKRASILSTSDSDPTEDIELPKLERGMIIGVDDDLLSAKRTIVNGCGKFYLHVDFDELTGAPLETYIDIGSGGGCERNLQFISRLMSIALRAGVPIETIIDQAKSIRPCTAYINRTNKNSDTSKGTSCPSAIACALEDLKSKMDAFYACDDETSLDNTDSTLDTTNDNNTTPTIIKADGCPKCGSNLRHEGGCVTCIECGYSKCD